MPALLLRLNSKIAQKCRCKIAKFILPTLLKSFKEDYGAFVKSLQENPLQGDELAPGIRKIRMAIKSKGKGKSGGARVITFNVLAEHEDGMIVLMLIYDKSDFSSVDVNVVKQLIQGEGYESDNP